MNFPHFEIFQGNVKTIEVVMAHAVSLKPVTSVYANGKISEPRLTATNPSHLWLIARVSNCRRFRFIAISLGSELL